MPLFRRLPVGGQTISGDDRSGSLDTVENQVEVFLGLGIMELGSLWVKKRQ